MHPTITKYFNGRAGQPDSGTVPESVALVGYSQVVQFMQHVVEDCRQLVHEYAATLPADQRDALLNSLDAKLYDTFIRDV